MADRHLNALPQGYELQGYRIEQELGAGGFGITYKATELLIGRAVAIKEYLPPAVALRGSDTVTVHPIGPRSREAFGFTAHTSFEEGLRKTIEWYRDERHGSAKRST